MSSCHVEGGAIVPGCVNAETKEWLEKQDIDVDSKHELFEALKTQNNLEMNEWTVVGGKSSINSEFLVLYTDENCLKKSEGSGNASILGQRQNHLQAAGR
ncbi:hypothetical protein J6590_005967 [Homalodisca vitripennis]|nr:hypothetical protein J6590_005967 [Homalodisca vitripennis]